MLYRLTLADGMIFNGGNLVDSKWDKIPNKLIKKVDYYFLGRHIILENYEAYAHAIVDMKGVACNINGVGRVILFAKNKNQVIRFNFNILKMKFDIDNKFFGCEYYDNPINSWKKGVCNFKPICKVI